ncbi:MAG TPA: dipeptide/oligopeptide/nickel ABC transporter ATP-binding protein, partial [Marmoricola sp.]|nr:dipeptide/oligopeptide/nickel ABC transporter ATP-binding protein [Marmoricola sp.]
MTTTANQLPDQPADSAADGENLLEVKGLVKHFPIRSAGMFAKRQTVQAVDNVDFFVRRGETLS